MAIITKQDILSDIELKVNQGAISDDSELDRRQIAAWVSEELNSLVTQECEQAQKRGEQIPPIYIVRETSNSLTVEDIAEVDEENERMYFTITGRVLDLKDDNGVVLVTDDENNKLFKGSVWAMPTIRNMRYTAPSSDILTWYRQGNSIFVEGFQAADVDLNTLIIYYVGYQDVVSMADTASIKISDIMLPVLKDKVTAIAMRQTYGTTPDQSNDGVDAKNQLYHTAIQNRPVNEQQ